MMLSLNNPRRRTLYRAARFASLAGVVATIVLPTTLRAQTVPDALPANRPVAALLCRFADVETTYGFTAEGIQQHMWEGPRSIDALIQEASLGTANLTGSQTFGWFTLPGAMASYSPDFVGAARIASDCAAVATAGGADLTTFTYLVVYLNDRLGGMEGGAFTSEFNGRPPTIVDRRALANTAVLTYRGLNSPGLVLHEIGHIFGGVHTVSAADPLGGASFYGTDPKLPLPDGTLRRNNVGPIWDAQNRDRMGFIPPTRKVTFAGGTQTVTMSRLTQPVPDRPIIVEVPIGTGTSAAGPNRYVVSARTRAGFDAGNFYDADPRFRQDPFLAVPGVMIQRIDGTAPVPVVLSRAGGDRSTTDGVFAPGQSFVDPENQITIAVEAFDENGATIRIASGPVATSTTTTTTTTTLPPPTTVPLPAATVIPSDAYAAAPEVRAVGNIGPINNQTATMETGEGEPCGRMIRSMWTKFVIPETGSYTAATAGSDFDTVLAAWKPSDRAPRPPFPWTVIACNDDFNGTPQSSITFTANAGDTVYFQGASNGKGGTISFDGPTIVNLPGPIAGNLLVTLKRN